MKIIILPGLDGTGLLLKEFADELSRHHDVEVISFPLELVAYEDIDAWLEPQLPADNYVIVAESFSGPLAIMIASRAPRNLKALFLFATFARSPRKIPTLLPRLLEALPYAPDFYALASLPFVMGRGKPPGFLKAYQAALRKVTLSTLVGRLHAVLKVDMRSMLPGIEIPIGYARAEQDLLVPKAISADFSSYCHAMHYIDASHFVLQSKPKLTAGLVRDFLARLD